MPRSGATRATGASASRRARDHDAQQRDVGDGVGELDQLAARARLDLVEHALHDPGRDEGGDRERADQCVHGRAHGHPRHGLADEQDEPECRQRVEGEPEHVADRAGLGVAGARQRDAEEEVAARPRRDGEREGEPGEREVARGERPGAHHRDRKEEEPVVEPSASRTPPSRGRRQRGS